MCGACGKAVGWLRLCGVPFVRDHAQDLLCCGFSFVLCAFDVLIRAMSVRAPFEFFGLLRGVGMRENTESGRWLVSSSQKTVF